MVEAKLLLDLSDAIKRSPGITTNQLCSTAILGSAVGTFDSYNPFHVYMKGDKIPYVTNDGELLVIVALADNVTGSFNPVFWEEFNLLDEVQGLYNDYIILSYGTPALRRNKVWLKIKDESVNDATDIIGAEMIEGGVTVYNNLIMSERRPTMKNGVIWGEITELIEE